MQKGFEKDYTGSILIESDLGPVFFSIFLIVGLKITIIYYIK